MISEGLTALRQRIVIPRLSGQHARIYLSLDNNIASGYDGAVTKDTTFRLYELADLIHGVARQIRAPGNLEPGPCTPVEITVMRFIHRNPGSSAGTAAEATLLPSSNFSRAIRGLEAKGLIRRQADPHDTRSVRLFPTPAAEANFERMREAWGQALQGIIEDLATIDFVNATLRQLEQELIARRRHSGEMDA